MYSHFVMVATLSSAGSLVRVDAAHVLDRPMRGPDTVLRYDDHADGVIDVFLPRPATDEDPPSAPGPTPLPAVDSQGASRVGAAELSAASATLVVLLHGGYWRQQWDRVHVRPLAWAFVRAGYVVATPEYRRGPSSWPHMRTDVDAALSAVRALLDEAAPGLIDPRAPYVLTGHSAGGHLALWGGLRAGPGVVRHIVALAPVADVRYAAQAGLDDDAAQDLLGGEPTEVPDRYADADVLRLLPGAVPITVIHGDADRQVPVEMSRELAGRLAGFAHETTWDYVELPDIDHFDLIDPESAAWPTVLGSITTPR
jgi:acetyl esterase/lipase